MFIPTPCAWCLPWFIMSLFLVFTLFLLRFNVYFIPNLPVHLNPGPLLVVSIPVQVTIWELLLCYGNWQQSNKSLWVCRLNELLLGLHGFGFLYCYMAPYSLNNFVNATLHLIVTRMARWLANGFGTLQRRGVGISSISCSTARQEETLETSVRAIIQTL